MLIFHPYYTKRLKINTVPKKAQVAAGIILFQASFGVRVQNVSGVKVFRAYLFRV